MTPTPSVLQTRMKILDWLTQEALPLWADAGMDGALGFAERLNLDGAFCDPGFKRARAQARQIYVFSHASQVFKDESYAETAERGFQFFRSHFHAGGGRWVRSVSRTGQLLDDTVDLYDQAFAVFGLAWLGKARPYSGALELAAETVSFTQTRLAHPSGLGLKNWDDAQGPRQQNPHMHWLEALLALYEASGDRTWLTEANEVASLFRNHFFCAERGNLPELFSDDLTAIDDFNNQRVEPGHQFEWAWLLVRLSALGGDNHTDIARRLTETARRMGYCQSNGLVVDGCSISGSQTSKSMRSWPQTEAAKAYLALYELGEREALANAAKTVERIFEHYLRSTTPGTWMDQLDERGEGTSTFVPSTTLYHIFLAFSEFLRVTDGSEKPTAVKESARMSPA